MPCPTADGSCCGLARVRTLITELEDSGPGIAPEIAGQLFEAFATFGKPHGTGLGLSICKKIIEDHHGWIARTRTDAGDAGGDFRIWPADSPHACQAA